MRWIRRLAVSAAASLTLTTLARAETVRMDFSEPTDVREVVEYVASWSGKPTIVDRNVNGKVQILAPDPLTKDVAHQRFVAALEQVGLTAVEHGGVVQILPIRLATPELEQAREALVVPELDTGTVALSMDFPDPTDVKDVVRDVAKWSNERFLLDRNVNGKVQIHAKKPVDVRLAYRIHLAVLNQLGLAELDRGPVTQILPQRSLKKARELRLLAPPTDGLGKVSIDRPQTSDIRAVLTDARGWYGRDLILDRNVNGKVQILSPGMLSKSDAYVTLVAALDLLGLTTILKDGAVVVVPYQTLDDAH